MDSSSLTSTDSPGAVYSVSMERSLSRGFLRYFRVFLLVMRAGAIQTVCPRFLPLAHLVYGKLRVRKSAL